MSTNNNYVGYSRNSRRVRTAVRALSVAGGGATALLTTISAYVGYRAVKPRRRLMLEVSPGLILSPESISFNSTDGLKLSGHFYPAQNDGRTIIICHGFHGGAVDLHDAALSLQGRGFNIFTFDFRGCGSSGGRTTSVGYYEVRDLLGAVDYIKQRPEVNANLIGVHGFSMGGATAIIAAASSLDIKAIITDSAFANLDHLLATNFRHFYRLPKFPFKPTTVLASKVFSNTVNKRVHPDKALAKMNKEERNIPLFIIHGELDRAIPVAQAQRLYDLHQGSKELWIVPDANHVVAMYADHEEYLDRVAGFFNRYLRQPTPNLV